MLKALRKELKEKSDPQKAESYARFFKEGSEMTILGLSATENRSIARRYHGLTFKELEELLNSPIHTERFIAALILVEKYNQGEKEKVFKFYVDHASLFNNWDLVDVSAYNIVGDFLLERDKNILYELVTSENLWERRIAIVATYAFIKINQLDHTFKLAKVLLHDKNDLIHKAVGWMLREAGKRNEFALETFLVENYDELPRTTLRYAIEKFPEIKRKQYLKKKFN